jgi:hypothetical protein
VEQVDECVTASFVFEVLRTRPTEATIQDAMKLRARCCTTVTDPRIKINHLSLWTLCEIPIAFSAACCCHKISAYAALESEDF